MSVAVSKMDEAETMTMNEGDDSENVKAEINVGEVTTESESKSATTTVPRIAWEWEWEAKKGSWVRYGKNETEKIDAALKDKNNTVELQMEESKLVIDFQKMSQKNLTTGFERKVRCAVKIDRDSFVWERQERRNQWRSYLPVVAEQLECAHSEDKTECSITVDDVNYTVDLVLMEQKSDGSTKELRRVQSKAAHSSTASPAPAAKVTRSMTTRSNVSAVTKRKPDADTKAPLTSAANKASGDDQPPTSKRAKVSAATVKSSAKSSKGSKKSAGEGQEKDTKRTVLVKGRAPVDPECSSMLGQTHVFCEGDDVYDAMLNQTNVQNNNNKYYICQLLEQDDVKRYHVWFRWGRVGFKGQNSLTPCGPDLEQAKKLFCQKFYDKTRNEWGSRKGGFEKVPGKYDMLEMDYAAGETSQSESKSSVSGSDANNGAVKQEEEPIAESKLDTRVQELMKLICDIKAMEQAVIELEYDAAKAPLGKLTSSQIKAGYAALKLIEECIETNRTKGKELIDACNEYYTRIPHCFGMRQPPLIRDVEMLKKEMDLVEALGDIEVAIRTLKSGDEKDEEGRRVNPVDRHYQSMNCLLKPIDPHDAQFQMVNDYLQNTHATTHRSYRMKVRHVYDCSKEQENKRFNNIGNRMLLWHGSRLTNWYGILSQGLRIAPPEAPVTGYMFGKGLYFADVSSKSANYCFATRQKNIGLLLLCDVALGKSSELLAADYNAHKLPDGTHSVKGLGQIAPSITEAVEIDDGECKVPLSVPQETGVDNPNGYTLNYNEYIVYDTRQTRMKYLVEVEFVF